MSDLPTDDELRELLAGRVHREREAEISALLAESAELRRRLEQLSGAEDFSEEFQTHSGEHNPPETAPTEPFQSALLVPSDRDDSLGRIGKFEILDIAGSGGMGTVLRAQDPDLDRTVALKVLSQSLSEDEKAVGHFRREATSIAAIEHENVLPIYDISEAGDSPFIVMRYIDGESLEDLLKRHSDGLPVRKVTRIALAVARALEAAHAGGIVHRDLKPSNILIEEDGGVWLMDFGLARPLDPDSEEGAKNRIVGTPHFMAPEQIGGGTIDARSDLFSLGSVIFFMLTGRPPFDSDDLQGVLWQVSNSEIKKVDCPSKVIPDWLKKLTLDLLHKDPDKRPADADTVVRVLRRSPLRHALRSPAFSAAALITTIVTAVVLAVLGTLQWQSHYREKYPFVTGDGERFESLNEAIDHRTGGHDVIEIHCSGFVPAKAAHWPGDLTIRSVGGHKVMLDARAGPKPFWTCDGNVVLEGISIRYQISKSTPPPFFVGDGPSLKLHHCRLAMPQVQEEVVNGMPIRTMFDISSISDVSVERCAMIGSEMSFLLVRSGEEDIHQKIVLRENMAYCRSLIHFEIPGTEESRIEAVVEDNISRCTNNFVVGGKTSTASGPLIPLHITAQRNSFEARFGLFFTSAGVLKEFSDYVHWHGSQNFYRNERFISSFRGPGRNSLPDTLSDWRNFSQSLEKESTTSRNYIFRFNERVAQNTKLSPLIANPSVAKHPRLYMKLDLDMNGPTGWSRMQLMELEQ